jgi:hypothetical protein
MLHSYIGTDPNHAGRVTTQRHSSDMSGSVTYAFNSCGFRGDEYDPDAAVKIFVAGCSYTFGLGLNLDDTWPAQFKRLYCAKFGCALDSVNVQNFAECGISNDGITRTLISQGAAVAPDLLLATFTHRDRSEVPIDGRTFKLGTWVHDDIARALEAQQSRAHGWWDGFDATVFDRLAEISTYYFLYYSKEIGLINLIRNVLLLQFFCEARRIAYVFALDATALDPATSDGIAGLRPLRDLINGRRVFPATIADDTVDRAADGRHPGPVSNRRFAERLFRFFVEASEPGRDGSR